MITDKNPRGAGRKPMPENLKKRQINLKLNPAILDWLDAQNQPKVKLVEDALVKQYNIKL